MSDESAKVVDVRRKIVIKENILILDEVIDKETEFVLMRENKNVYEFLHEVTTMYELLADSLWQYMLCKISSITETYSDSGSNYVEEKQFFLAKQQTINSCF